MSLSGIAASRLFQLRRTVVERLGDDGVHRHERPGDRLVGTDGTELEAVSGEGERAGPVAVAGILGERREDIDADRECPLGQGGIGTARLDLFEHVGELVSQEDRDDGGGSFVRPQAVIVPRRGDDRAEESLMLVNGTDDGRTEEEELCVFVRRVAGIEQVPLAGAAE